MTTNYQLISSKLKLLALAATIIISLYSCQKEENKIITSSEAYHHIEKSLQPSDLPLKDVNQNVLVGSPINNDLSDSALNTIAQKEFSAVQALYYARFGGWNGVNSFDFVPMISVINWSVENGISSHVHMLVGPDQYMPDWLINGNWTNQQLSKLLKNQIYSIMNSNDNKTKVDVWNVINEIFNEDGTYRTDVLWNQLGWENDASGLTGAVSYTHLWWRFQ